MTRPSTNGARPRKPVSIWEKMFSFSTTVAFLLVAVWIDQPAFFVVAAFAAVAAVAALYKGVTRAWLAPPPGWDASALSSRSPT